MNGNGLAISAMTEKDLPAVLAIEQQAPSPWSLAQLEGELFAANGWQFVCRRENTGRVCGYAMARHVAGEAENLKIGVNLEDQRQGVASLLLTILLDNMGSKGVRKCHLELRATNTPARLLYEKFAFQMTGRRKNYYTDPQEDAICLSRDIQADK